MAQCTGDGCCNSCRSWVGSDFFNDCCRGCGFYGGAEIMWLKPFATTFGAALINASSANEFLPAWRLWGGYQNSDGLGWRVGWWQWDQSSVGSDQGLIGPENSTNQLRLVFQKLDLEMTQMLSFRRWDLMLGAGITYVGNTSNFRSDWVDPDPQSFFANARFDGWGLTAGLLAIRDLPRWPGLKLVSAVQWSGVYGNSVISGSPFDDEPPQTIQLDSTMANILELRIGPQYERALGGGTTLFVGGGLEAQYWAGLGGLFL